MIRFLALWEKGGFDEGDGFKYIMVMMDNLSILFVLGTHEVMHGSVDR